MKGGSNGGGKEFGGRREAGDKPVETREDPRQSAQAHSELNPLDLVKQRAVAEADRERVQALLRDPDLSWQQRMVLKEINHLREKRPRPDLPPDRRRDIEEIAFHLHEDHGRVEELARDPDHGGAVTDNSLDEADIGLRLERDGRLRNVVRDPRTGCGDLIEGAGVGRQWDVYTPPGDRFSPDDIEGELKRKIELQRQDEWMIRVIANTVHLSRDQVDVVREIVHAHGWDHLVMFAASRQRRSE